MSKLCKKFIHCMSDDCPLLNVSNHVLIDSIPSVMELDECILILIQALTSSNEQLQIQSMLIFSFISSMIWIPLDNQTNSINNYQLRVSQFHVYLNYIFKEGLMYQTEDLLKFTLSMFMHQMLPCIFIKYIKELSKIVDHLLKGIFESDVVRIDLITMGIKAMCKIIAQHPVDSQLCMHVWIENFFHFEFKFWIILQSDINAFDQHHSYDLLYQLQIINTYILQHGCPYCILSVISICNIYASKLSSIVSVIFKKVTSKIQPQLFSLKNSHYQSEVSWIEALQMYFADFYSMVIQLHGRIANDVYGLRSNLSNPMIMSYNHCNHHIDVNNVTSTFSTIVEELKLKNYRTIENYLISLIAPSDGKGILVEPFQIIMKTSRLKAVACLLPVTHLFLSLKSFSAPFPIYKLLLRSLHHTLCTVPPNVKFDQWHIRLNSKVLQVECHQSSAENSGEANSILIQSNKLECQLDSKLVLSIRNYLQCFDSLLLSAESLILLSSDYNMWNEWGKLRNVSVQISNSVNIKDPTSVRINPEAKRIRLDGDAIANGYSSNITPNVNKPQGEVVSSRISLLELWKELLNLKILLDHDMKSHRRHSEILPNVLNIDIEVISGAVEMLQGWIGCQSFLQIMKHYFYLLADNQAIRKHEDDQLIQNYLFHSTPSSDPYPFLFLSEFFQSEQFHKFQIYLLISSHQPIDFQGQDMYTLGMFSMMNPFFCFKSVDIIHDSRSNSRPKDQRRMFSLANMDELFDLLDIFILSLHWLLNVQSFQHHLSIIAQTLQSHHQSNPLSAQQIVTLFCHDLLEKCIHFQILLRDLIITWQLLITALTEILFSNFQNERNSIHFELNQATNNSELTNKQLHRNDVEISQIPPAYQTTQLEGTNLYSMSMAFPLASQLSPRLFRVNRNLRSQDVYSLDYDHGEEPHYSLSSHSPIHAERLNFNFRMGTDDEVVRNSEPTEKSINKKVSTTESIASLKNVVLCSEYHPAERVVRKIISVALSAWIADWITQNPSLDNHSIFIIHGRTMFLESIWWLLHRTSNFSLEIEIPVNVWHGFELHSITTLQCPHITFGAIMLLSLSHMQLLDDGNSPTVVSANDKAFAMKSFVTILNCLKRCMNSITESGALPSIFQWILLYLESFHTSFEAKKGRKSQTTLQFISIFLQFSISQLWKMAAPTLSDQYSQILLDDMTAGIRNLVLSPLAIIIHGHYHGLFHLFCPLTSHLNRNTIETNENDFNQTCCKLHITMQPIMDRWKELYLLWLKLEQIKAKLYPNGHVSMTGGTIQLAMDGLKRFEANQRMTFNELQLIVHPFLTDFSIAVRISIQALESFQQFKTEQLTCDSHGQIHQSIQGIHQIIFQYGKQMHRRFQISFDELMIFLNACVRDDCNTYSLDNVFTIYSTLDYVMSDTIKYHHLLQAHRTSSQDDIDSHEGFIKSVILTTKYSIQILIITLNKSMDLDQIMMKNISKREFDEFIRILKLCISWLASFDATVNSNNASSNDSHNNFVKLNTYLERASARFQNEKNTSETLRDLICTCSQTMNETLTFGHHIDKLSSSNEVTNGDRKRIIELE